ESQHRTQRRVGEDGPAFQIFYRDADGASVENFVEKRAVEFLRLSLSALHAGAARLADARLSCQRRAANQYGFLRFVLTFARAGFQFLPPCPPPAPPLAR